ncbi:cell wall hydrolase [Senegalia massiliensis]|uniref:cell wall hydrolase n=1 Tax=Senegalia massiliensis TaxID=1720316 RepID=UPI001030AC29|nr:cell wall hydrolase [Senegalia massiliensis]
MERKFMLKIKLIAVILIFILSPNFMFAEKFNSYPNIKNNLITMPKYFHNKSILYKNNDFNMKYKISDGKIYPIGVLGVNTDNYNKNNLNEYKIYSYDDFYWLSRIIHAESKGESYDGKVAVGSVVMNRVNSNKFPDTIKEVIFEQNKNTSQFTPVSTGSIINTPSEDSMKAALDALEGKKPVGNSLFFLNPDTANSNWIINNREFILEIDNHMFYK